MKSFEEARSLSSLSDQGPRPCKSRLAYVVPTQSLGYEDRMALIWDVFILGGGGGGGGVGGGGGGGG